MNKCPVFGCKRGHESEEPQHEDYHAFYFPLDERKSHLLPAWEKFVCRDGWKPSANSVICEFHFEDRLIRKGKRWTLKWKLNPMPTMLTDEMKAMPQSVQPTPAAPPRKPPAKRTYQEDVINAFLSQDIIGDFSELNSTHALPGFQCTNSDNSLVFFNQTYVDGFPVIFESIKVDQSLHVQLQFNGHPVPLPAWFTKGRNATLTRFSQLNNFPNAIRVVSEETECSRSLLNEMLDISNYQAKGRPPYSSAMIRFALHLRYTSLQSYKLLEKFPLPSISTLHRLQTGGVDSLKAEYTSHCFAIMDYSYNIVQAHGVRDVRAAYTQIFDRFSPQIDICCSKHNNWGLKFAAKIVINTFFNNKQTVSFDSERKDTVVAFKKRQKTK